MIQPFDAKPGPVQGDINRIPHENLLVIDNLLGVRLLEAMPEYERAIAVSSVRGITMVRKQIAITGIAKEFVLRAARDPQANWLSEVQDAIRLHVSDNPESILEKSPHSQFLRKRQAAIFKQRIIGQYLVANKVPRANFDPLDFVLSATVSSELLN